MPKIRPAAHAPSIDMTPMVDLAFLLVTFFMLTASFRMAEPVVVDPPSSVSDKTLPENTVLISVDLDGRSFFGVGNAEARRNTLAKMSEKYKISFTEKQIQTFEGLPSFGVDIKNLPDYLDANEAKRKDFRPQKGVPLDSMNNQLRDWIQISATELNVLYTTNKEKAESEGKAFIGEKPRYAIKADSKVKYIYVKDVFKTFTDMQIYTFNLITAMEGGSTVAPAKAN